MRNKRVKLLLPIFIILIIAMGCSVNKNKEETKDAQVDKELSEVVITNYEYKQPLNIIDDNYRTYYEVFLYSFYDSDGDGIGDINGLISKLDYINDGDDKTDNDMGFNGIWLMPIMTSTTYHKYDVVDYYSIDPEYGTMDDFKRLITECDKRGIKVIMDFVINHTSTKNQWFESATRSLYNELGGKNSDDGQTMSIEENKYVNYYNFISEEPKDGKYYPVGASGWYYEAVFWDQMPDLNLSDENLRKELEDIMTYWLDLGIGGFRLDAAKEFYTGNQEKNTEVLEWITGFVKSKSEDNYLVAEVWDGFSIYSKYYKSGIDSIFNFAFAQETGKIVKTLNLVGPNNSAKAFGEAMILVEDTLMKYNKGAIDASFFTNHDTGRAAGMLSYNDTKIKMAAGMNLMMNGSSFVYYGEEIGMSGSGRDENKRAPMYWSKDSKEGMTTGPKEMETQEHKFMDLEEQEKDNNSILNYYKRAIRLRNENPEIARGDISYIDNIIDTDICAIRKVYEGSQIILLYNISGEVKTVTLDKEEEKYQGIRGYLTTDQSRVMIEGNAIILPPYSITILK